MTEAIICDLDGTLCDTEHRSHLVSGEWGKKDYDAFYGAMDKDPPFAWCAELLRTYCFSKRRRLIFVTGRPERYRDKTEKWLLQHCEFYAGQDYDLYMRPDGNFEHDTLIKSRIYSAEIEGKYLVEFVLEDRARVVEMWRELGLTCLQVAKGDF